MSSLGALKADTHRVYGKFTWANFVKGLLTQRTFRVLVTMRVCQVLANSNFLLKMLLPIFMVLHRINTQYAAMDISWRTNVGPGLALTHGWGVVINPEAVIGKNVTLFHGVTLGRRDRISRNGDVNIEYPILEDEVWVGPNAIIVGGVTIGRGSRIAGGAFVVESVPAYSVVVGNPSKIVKSNCIPDVTNPIST
jgi:serine O-acetyltransferase